MGWLRDFLSSSPSFGSFEVTETFARQARHASFLESALPMAEHLPAGVCQRYVITDGLHDLVYGIPEWRHYKSEWMGGRKSAPLAAMSQADYGLLLQARKHFIKAREQMLLRDYHPQSASDSLKLAKDPATFFKTTTPSAASEIQAGLVLVKRLVQQQKGAEFEDAIQKIDYATRRRQLMTLENIQELASTMAQMVKECGSHNAKQLWTA
ncbi:Poly(A)-specific ribonuclease PARN [Durusdinium trenchii]|uniref:Poly(A)-specific ribonuclease PARN n=1 Tax=Durusdinium trenchii TaxID=1381693 RepID=A0ABP0MI35_9DINO